MEGIKSLCTSCVDGNVPCKNKIIVIEERKHLTTYKCINYNKDNNKIQPYIEQEYVSFSVCR